MPLSLFSPTIKRRPWWFNWYLLKGLPWNWVFQKPGNRHFLGCSVTWFWGRGILGGRTSERLQLNSGIWRESLWILLKMIDLQLCPSRRCLQETNILATPALVWSQGPAEAKWKNPFQTFLTSTISQGACYLSRQEAQIQAPYMRSDSKLADCQELWLPQRKSNSFVHPTNVYEASTLPRHRYLQVPCWSLWLQLWATCSPWAQGAYNLEGKTDN